MIYSRKWITFKTADRLISKVATEMIFRLIAIRKADKKRGSKEAKKKNR